MKKEIISINNVEIDVYRTSNNAYGNPRYIVHYLALGLSDWKPTDATRAMGFQRYRGADFGGGFVFSSYSPEATLKKYFVKRTAV